MTLPGTTVTLRNTPPPASVPSDTTTWFVTGLADSGPLTPVTIRSLAEFVSIFSDRVSYSILYDAVDAFFREGGSSVCISRVVGPAATYGFKNLVDGVAATSLVVTAIGPGAYSANIKVGVVAGVGSGTYQIQITDLAGNILEQSGDLPAVSDAVTWSTQSNYVRITLGASALDPIVVAPAALSAGADDRLNITEAHWKLALDKFYTDLGPGQVSAPGRTTDTSHTDLLQHAKDHRRSAVLDPPDTPTVATLLTAVTNCRIGNERFGAMFAPWLLAPGVVRGTVRTVPPSALVAGLISKNEAEFGPDAPSAGSRGIARYATGPTQPAWTDAQREQLNNGGVDVIMNRLGQLEVYGWRSLTNPVTDPDWIGFGNSRLYMAIAAEADVIGEQFLFDVIDGQGQLISDFGGALSAMLQRFYTQGSLYGQSADQAFFVDVGDQVNTPVTIAANQLKAVLNVRMSPFSEMVAIEIVKTPITQSVN